MAEGSQNSEAGPSQEKKDAEIDVGLVEKDGAIGLKHDKISNMKTFSFKKNLYKQTCRILNHYWV